jgi:FecR-like protein
MKTLWRRAVPLLGFSILVFPMLATAARTSDTYRRIVRLRYVEGDVRFNPGSSKGPDLSKPWRGAEANLPIEQGFALATGTGRAEVEFEDGSTIYLADNSVLSFPSLGYVSGTPETEVELVSGTATLALQPTFAAEFTIDTPTDRFVLTHPELGFVRVDSYLDGTEATPEGNQNTGVRINGNDQVRLVLGQRIRFQYGRLLKTDARNPAKEPDAWDNWVSDREQKRETDTKAALAATGRSVPIAGLADLYENGSFYSCAPFVTCWEPSAEALAHLSAQAPAGDQVPWRQATPEANRATIQPESTAQTTQGAATSPQGSSAPVVHSVYFFPPCDGYAVREDTVVDSVTNKRTTTYHSVPNAPYTPWEWAQCNEGGWIHVHKKYQYVVGRMRHHHKPYHWVKVGNRTGFVPRHPNDTKGKPPLNLKSGLIVPTGKSGKTFELVHVRGSEPVKLLAQAPAKFRESTPDHLFASRPDIRAHLMETTAKDAGRGEAKDERVITYDYGKKDFVRTLSGSAIGERSSKTEVVARLTGDGASMLRPSAFGGAHGEGFVMGDSRVSGSSVGGGSAYRGGAGGYAGGHGNGGGGYSGGHGGGAGESGYSGGRSGGGGGSSGGGGGGGGSHGGGSSGGSGGGGGSSGGSSSSGGGSGGGSSSGRSK